MKAKKLTLEDLLDLAPNVDADARSYIVFLQGGKGFVGRAMFYDDVVYMLSGGYYLNRWGTTRGPLELAEGPTAETEYFPSAPVVIERNQVRFVQRTKLEAWAK